MSQQQIYFNTTQLSNPTLQRRIERAKGEQKEIYNLLLNNPGTGFCWFEMASLLYPVLGYRINDCSAKRSLSVLAKEGYFIKTSNFKISPAKAKCFEYIFNTELLITN